MRFKLEEEGRQIGRFPVKQRRKSARLNNSGGKSDFEEE